MPSRKIKIKREESERGDKDGRQGAGEEKEKKDSDQSLLYVPQWALKKGNSDVGWKQDRQRSNESEAQRERRLHQRSE